MVPKTAKLDKNDTNSRLDKSCSVQVKYVLPLSIFLVQKTHLSMQKTHEEIAYNNAS